MIKLINESLERRYPQRYAIIDLDKDEVFCDSDDLADLYFQLKDFVNNAIANNSLILERSIHNRLRQLYTII